jgi:hypothetical protein
MIDLLGRFSRSTWEVGYAGKVDRLRELLAEKPERARAMVTAADRAERNAMFDVARLLRERERGLKPA